MSLFILNLIFFLVGLLFIYYYYVFLFSYLYTAGIINKILLIQTYYKIYKFNRVIEKMIFTELPPYPKTFTPPYWKHELPPHYYIVYLGAFTNVNSYRLRYKVVQQLLIFSYYGYFKFTKRKQLIILNKFFKELDKKFNKKLDFCKIVCSAHIPLRFIELGMLYTAYKFKFESYMNNVEQYVVLYKFSEKIKRPKYVITNESALIKKRFDGTVLFHVFDAKKAPYKSLYCLMYTPNCVFVYFFLYAFIDLANKYHAIEEYDNIRSLIRIQYLLLIQQIFSFR
jgi:hypothetical protein